MTVLPPACSAYQDELLDQLDQRTQELPQHPHLLECAVCQALHQSAVAFVTAPALVVPPMSTARTEQIVQELQDLAARQRRSRRIAWLAAGGLVALVIGSLAYNQWGLSPSPFPTVPTTVPPRVTKPASPSPKLEETISDAGAALVSVTRRTTEQTLRPAQGLLSWSNPLPSSSEEMPLESAAEPLRSLPNSARSGLDPVATGTKRAMTRILSDLSAWNPAKPKS